VAAGELYSAVTMHFVTEEYDQGPVFFEYKVPVIYSDWERLKRAVNDAEHYFQPYVTDLVVNGKIIWDGEDPNSLRAQKPYQFLPALDTGWR
jgi:folate-dependent phosphoribosylglycinamide formyltransferase PurN